MNSPSAKTVLDNIRERCTYMQRPEEFRRVPAVCEFNEEKTGEYRPAGIATSEEYELTLTVGVRYWANRAQHSDARRNAESILARTLYEDVLRDLAQIRHAAMDGDQRATVSRINELEARLTR